MKKTEIVSCLTRNFNRVGLQLKKHSPEILMAAGIIGGVTSAVMACKATTKVDTIMAELNENMAKVEKAHNLADPKKYTDEDATKDTIIYHTQAAIKLAKLYAPAVAVGAISVVSILASNNIMRKRNVALAAAYATVDSGFKEYRNRIVERFGEELDRELKHNIKVETIKDVVVDEDGKETEVERTVEVANPNNHSTYARFYDDGCKGWSKDANLNLLTLRNIQNHCNDILRTKGHLFLNEVYDMLGIYRTREGQVVGWIYDEKNPVGDNFVDFGIYDKDDREKRRFVNGIERVILLDFNVDGPILNLI